MTKDELTESYHEFLLERLRDPAKAIAYLNAAIEEDDDNVFLLALRNVAEARQLLRPEAPLFDRRKYAALLSDALPVVITTEAEYDQTLAEIKRLLRKGEANLSPEEERLLGLLSTLAESWEEAHHAIPTAPGYRILQHYMQIRGLRQADLQPILGSRAVTSAIVNGKRSITAEQATQLGSLFGISPAVFI